MSGEASGITMSNAIPPSRHSTFSIRKISASGSTALRGAHPAPVRPRKTGSTPVSSSDDTSWVRRPDLRAKEIATFSAMRIQVENGRPSSYAGNARHSCT
jgi:hypothetical protein